MYTSVTYEKHIINTICVIACVYFIYMRCYIYQIIIQDLPSMLSSTSFLCAYSEMHTNLLGTTKICLCNIGNPKSRMLIAVILLVL